MRGLSLIFATLVLTLSANANILPPISGGTVTPDLLTPSPSSTVLYSFTGSVVVPPFYNSMLTIQVLSDPLNAWCVGCLDWVYTVSNNGPDLNGRLSEFSFGGFLVDAGYNPATSGDIPATADRSFGVVANSVGFNFPGEIKAGEHSSELVIETNATLFQNFGLIIIDGTHVAGSFGRQPVPVEMIETPEPASLVMLGSGLGLLIIPSWGRRRQARYQAPSSLRT